MCLYIRKDLHPDLQPLIAESDLCVEKGIVVSKPGWDFYPGYHRDGPYTFFLKEQYYTPFTKTPVVFDEEGKCVMKAENFGSDIRTDMVGTSIAAGIHSLSHQGVYNGLVRLNVQMHGGDQLLYFDAIIPKGTKYYVGYDFDYASEELIIYEFGCSERVEKAKKT